MNPDLQAAVASIEKADALLTSLRPAPLLGLATPSGQTGWDTSTATLGPVPVLRSYQSGTPTAVMPKVTGPTRLILSSKPPVSGFTPAADSAVAAWAGAMPAGTRVTVQHEPEQRSKNITPAAYRLLWDHYVPIIRAANHGLLVAPILMAYTTDLREPGKNDWLAALAGTPNLPDEILWDAYYMDSYGDPTAILEPCRTLGLSIFPNAKFGLAEWGTMSADDTATAAFITGSHAYLTRVEATVACWFNVTMTGSFELTPSAYPKSVAAFKALPRSA